jgi:hypothetical protein
MLRTALKILLALALIAQGGISAFAQDGMGPAAVKMHCQHPDEHGKQAKVPCCPDGCMPDGISACAACAMAFILPVPVVVPLVEHTSAGSQALGVMVASSSRIPPTRPPIA